jgi:CBS domain-containing protein
MHKGVIGCKPSTPLDEVVRIMADTNLRVIVVTGPDDEITLDNNAYVRPVRVIDEKVRVLMVFGTPTWEYRYLHGAFDRDKRVRTRVYLESLDRRIIVPLTGVSGENSHVLGHELVHAFQMEPKIIPTESATPLQRQPIWFVEGQAEYLSLGQEDPLTSMWMRDAVLHLTIPSIDELSWKSDEFFPYRFGEAVWAWIGRTWGDAGVRSFSTEAMEKGIAAAIDSAFGVKSMEDFSRRWKDDLLKTTMPQLAGRTLPENAGRMLPGIGGGTSFRAGGAWEPVWRPA